MAQAKTIPDEMLDWLIDEVIRTSRNPVRDVLILLFSFKAGMRVGEIAGLTWRDVVDASGVLGDKITIPNNIAKKGHGREIDMHPLIKEALEAMRDTSGPEFTKGRHRVIRGAAGAATVKPNSLVVYFRRLYLTHGLDATSHSGRRTAITKLARMANDYDCSLKDVQSFAGHRYIDTTERYINYSPNAKRMIHAL